MFDLLINFPTDKRQKSLWNKVLSITGLDLVEDSTQSVLNVSIKFDTWKNIENCTVIEEQILLYICYEHESPRSCNTLVYLSWFLHLENVLGVKFHTGEHENLWLSQC